MNTWISLTSYGVVMINAKLKRERSESFVAPGYGAILEKSDGLQTHNTD